MKNKTMNIKTIFIEDNNGFEYEVNAEVRGPIDELHIFNVTAKSDNGTLSFEYPEDMPDIFDQDVLRKIYEAGEEAVSESQVKEYEY